MILAAHDLGWPGSSTLSAPFYVMTSLPHYNRNAGSCTDGYTTVSEGSREYPHKLSGKKNQHFLRGQRSKLKECGLSAPLSDETI